MPASARLTEREKVPKEEPSSKFFKWIGVNAAIFGIEVSTSVVFTYVPPLLLKSGFTESTMSIVMGIGPAIALFSIPKIGQLSDSTRTRFGRRRPVILGLSLMLMLACAIIPLHGLIVRGIGLEMQSPISLSILAVSVIALHCLSLISFNPCESLLGDLLQPYPKFAPVGFMIYSATLSFGACVGFLITGLNWVELFGSTTLNQDHIAFLMVFGFFLIGIVVTMIIAKEDQEYRAKEAVGIRMLAYRQICDEDMFDKTVQVSCDELVNTEKLVWNEEKTAKKDVVLQATKYRLEKMNQKLGRLKRKYPVAFSCLYYPYKLIIMPIEMVKEVVVAPRVMQMVAFADLFAWLGVNCHTLFFTDFVGQGIFHGNPRGLPGSQEVLDYEDGVRFGSLGLLFHSILSCLYSATIQERVARKFGLRAIWISGMGIFTLSMVGLCITNNKISLQVFATLSGMGFVVITSVPNSLTTIYNGSQHVYYPDLNSSKPRGLGQDIAILDIAFYSSQILLALFIGSLVEYTGYPHWYIIVAAICGGLSVIFGFFLRYPDIRSQKPEKIPEKPELDVIREHDIKGDISEH